MNNGSCDTERRLRALAERQEWISKRARERSAALPDNPRQVQLSAHVGDRQLPVAVQEERAAERAAPSWDKSLYFDPLDDIPSDSELVRNDEEPPALLAEAPALKGFGFQSFVDDSIEEQYLAEEYDSSFPLRVVGQTLWFTNRVGHRYYVRFYAAPPAVICLDRLLCFVASAVQVAIHSDRVVADRAQARRIGVLTATLCLLPTPLLCLVYYVRYDVQARIWSDALSMERRDMFLSLFLCLQTMMYKMGSMPIVGITLLTLICALANIVQQRAPTAWMTSEGQDEIAMMIYVGSPLLGIVLNMLLERRNRLTFAAQVHATRLLSLRIDQLSAEKERLDYERRMAVRSRAASRSNSGHSGSRGSRKGRHRVHADSPSRAPAMVDREETVKGGNLFANLEAAAEGAARGHSKHIYLSAAPSYPRPADAQAQALAHAPSWHGLQGSSARHEDGHEHPLDATCSGSSLGGSTPPSSESADSGSADREMSVGSDIMDPASLYALTGKARRRRRKSI